MGNPDSKQLMMLRPSLPIPDIRLPEDWSVRPMLPDECSIWASIMEAAGFAARPGESPQAHWARSMGADPGVKTENVFFACDAEGMPVATATARLILGSGHDRRLRPGDNPGYLHYVAARPESRGKRAGMGVIAAVLKRFDELGVHPCLLTTDDFRLAALRIYLKMGWLPVLYRPDMRIRWEKVLLSLGCAGDFPAFDADWKPAEPIMIHDA